MMCVRLIPALLTAAIALAESREDEVKPLLVMIKAQWEDRAQDPPQNGAGIIFGHQSGRLYIATANHVVRYGPREAKKIDLLLKWLPGETRTAALTRHFDSALDLAVLIITGAPDLAVPALPFNALGNSGSLTRRGPVKVETMGYPGGKEWFARAAPDVVSGGDRDTVRFDAAWIGPGYSGGGLFTDRWEIVGMIRRDNPPEGEAVRIERVIERLKEWGYPVGLSKDEPVAASPPKVSPDRPLVKKQRAGAVWIRPGTFLMGCSPGGFCLPSEANPPVRTTIAKGFWMNETEVNQTEYERLIGSNPSQFRGPSNPVENVTWHQAQAYCAKAGGRLPISAEWEYAARAGTTRTAYGDLKEIAWGSHHNTRQTQRVRQLKPNSFGLYDMMGNVWEWTATDFDALNKEVRGGYWGSAVLSLRVSLRGRRAPTDHDNTLGFRCVWD